jgi:hypothetical protein
MRIHLDRNPIVSKIKLMEVDFDIYHLALSICANLFTLPLSAQSLFAAATVGQTYKPPLVVGLGVGPVLQAQTLAIIPTFPPAILCILHVCAGGDGAGVETGAGGGALDHAHTTRGLKSSAWMLWPFVQLVAVAEGGPHDTAVAASPSQLKAPMRPELPLYYAPPSEIVPDPLTVGVTAPVLFTDPVTPPSIPGMRSPRDEILASTIAA